MGNLIKGLFTKVLVGSGETTQDSAAAELVAVGAATLSGCKEASGRNTRTWSQHGLGDLQSRDTVIRQQYCREGGRETVSNLTLLPSLIPLLLLPIE